MGKIQLKSAASWEVFEEGYYPAEIANIDITEHAADKFHDDPYPQLKWTFILHIPGREDFPRFTAWTSMSLNKKSKLVPLLDAFGVPYGKDSFDTADALGKFGRINIGEYKKSDGTFTNNAQGYSPYRGPALKSALGSVPAGQTVQGTKPAPKNDEDESDIPF